MYIGRLFNLLAFLALVYITISIMPVLKWAMFLLALMPQTIFIAASISADGPLLGYCFVTFAYFLYLALDGDKHSIGKKELSIILLLAVVLGLAKTPYFLLVLLFLMIPRDRLKDRRRYYLIFVLVLVVASMVCAGWMLVVKDANRRPTDYKPGAQLKRIIKNPLKLLQVTYSTSRNQQGLMSARMPSVQQIVGTVGWVAFVLPVWFGFLYLFTLITVSAIDKEDVQVGLMQKAVSLCTAVLIGAAILAICYLFWSPLGSNTIAGVNSRYFIPIAPLILLLFYNQKIRYAKGLWFFALVLSFSAVSIFITIFWMLKNCYG